jgi:CRISPR-associated endonuclease Csn1
MQQRRYRVGVDVGLNSVGLAAIEIDDNCANVLDEIPISILNAQSVIHDGGVDPKEAQKALSRKATAGVARRTRKLRDRKRKRLSELDKTLAQYNFPIIDMSQFKMGTDPYIAWRVRAKLAEVFITDETVRKRLISIAIRHIARHRGWRNPYSSVEEVVSLSDKPSKWLIEYAKRLDREIHIKIIDEFYRDP